MMRSLKLIGPIYFRYGEAGAQREGCIRLNVEECSLAYPTSTLMMQEGESMPFECRLAHKTYEANFYLSYTVELEGHSLKFKKQMGPVPIMVGSNKCNLVKKMTHAGKRLVDMHEEDRESGGYFIVNGNERMIRLLVAPRRHVPLLLDRASLTKCGPMFSRHGIFMRSVREDGTGASMQLLYLTDGTVMVRTWIQRRAFFLPLAVLMRACSPLASDEEIFRRVRGDADDNDTFVLERLAALLNQGRDKGLVDHESCLLLLGSEFRNALNWLSQDMPLREVGKYFLERFILVHIKDGHERMLMLAHMTTKLFSLVRGEVQADNLDALHTQEIWTSGQIYGMVFKEKLWTALYGMATFAAAQLTKLSQTVSLEAQDEKYFRKNVFGPSSLFPICTTVTTFVATGNFISKFCSDLQQESGFVILAEKLNHLRYTAHFRCVHRGAYFQEMKTTTVRKLMPESWGFFCPVHTPDGAPCGLLNHLTADCVVDPGSWEVETHFHALVALMEGRGLLPASRPPTRETGLTVLLDGRVAGQVPDHLAARMVAHLRALKRSGASKHVSPTLEICHVPRGGTQYPGIWMFSGQGRPLRRVRSLRDNLVEWIGSAEQPYMDIAVDATCVTDASEYVELSATAMLSLVARLTPFCDFNQSPRNMYQCQMAKQTMGVPATAYQFRSDNKMFRLTYGQRPIVRTQAHVKYEMDNYPNGLNAVVAVLAYTGYDMEDAMIINKGSYDRGIAQASVYYSLTIDLRELAKMTGYEAKDLYFDNSEGPHRSGPLQHPHVDEDGLPKIGTLLKKGDILYVYYNRRTKRHEAVPNKKQDPVIVDVVVPIGQFDAGSDVLRVHHVLIKLREPRNAIIGDKFSSRHGQKGTLSRLWPHEDMPFSDNGIVPDVLINPHAFPSRMTVGMLMESMAGKAGALHGLDQDGTPFMFSETDRAVDYFGKQLRDAGYSYYGSESMYSGIFGTELKVDIFMGVVFYQRLRHMVGDKFQSRAEGAVNALTHQPVGGRKNAGGIRFGEMERDSLLAHGASFLINDRLFQSSDYSQAFCCGKCGSILSPVVKKGLTARCKSCDTSDHMQVVALPFVFRYLAAEFAAFGISCALHLKPVSSK